MQTATYTALPEVHPIPLRGPDHELEVRACIATFGSGNPFLLTVKPTHHNKAWLLFICFLLFDFFLPPSVTRRAADGNPCLSRERGLPR
jgi:hypothetical protein